MLIGKLKLWPVSKLATNPNPLKKSIMKLTVIHKQFLSVTTAVVICLYSLVCVVWADEKEQQNTSEVKPQPVLSENKLIDEKSTTNQKASANLQNQMPSSRTSSSKVLKLEDTIRANKEQPQVLTIVPWQLPTHHQINQTKDWQLPVKKMKPIERGAFLKKVSNNQ